MKTDLLLLSLLYAIAFAALIGAVNARGVARMVISYFLAILCFCLAGFHTFDHFNATAPVPLPAEMLPTHPEKIPSQPDSQAPAATNAPESATEENAQTAEPTDNKQDLQTALAIGQRVAKSLASLNLGAISDISDEEYEALQNHAANYLSEARRAKDKVPAADATPAALKDARNSLASGMESLVVAAYNAERFFKSENDVEEKTHLNNFRRSSQAAIAAFKNTGSLLGSEEP